MKKQFANLIVLNNNILVSTFLLFIFSVSASAKHPPLDSVQVLNPPPKIIRTCCVFGSDLSILHIPFIKKTDTVTVARVGKHCFLGNTDENNGIVYTHRGGFIDLAHLRDCADWTAYLACLIDYVQSKNTTVVIKLGIEGGEKKLLFNIPGNFTTNQKHQLAAKIAYELSLWHEIATWYGASYVPLMPERYSSFSPEDLYSNLMGTHLCLKALNSDMDYDKAMTFYVSEMLDSLQAVKTGAETFDAMNQVQDIWWSNNSSLPSRNILIKRYFDSEYSLKPWLLPNDTVANNAVLLSKVTDPFQYVYQFRVKLNFHFPIKSLSNTGTITQNDFDKILSHIKAEL